MYLSNRMKKYLLIFILLLVLLLKVFSFSTENELFYLAESRYFAKNYAIGLETYDEFVKSYPLSDLLPDVQYRRAVCLYRLGHYTDAMVTFKRVEKRYRSTRYLEYVPYWAGLIFYQQKDYSSAINTFNSFISQVKDTETVATALFYKGISEIFIEDYKEAEKTFLDFLARFDSNNLKSNVLVLLAYTYLKGKMYVSVIELVETVDFQSQKEKDREKLLFYKAEALWHLDKIDEAEKEYSKLLEAPVAIAKICFMRLFVAAQEKDDFSQLERLMQQAENIFSSYPELLIDLWINMGIESYKRKNPELAEHFFTKVWNLRERHEIKYSVPLYLAEIMLKKGKREESILILEAYISSKEEIEDQIIMRTGDLYLMGNNFKLAENYYSWLLDKDSSKGKKIEATYYLAYSYYRQDRNDEALTLVQEILSAGTPEIYHKELLKLLAILYKKTGRLEDALNTLKQHIALFKDDVAAYISYIKLLFLQKEYSNVITNSKEIQRIFPSLHKNDPYSYYLNKYFAGLSYIVKKMYSEAKNTLSQIPVMEAEKAGLKVIIPYSLFYRAWATYRLGDFKRAAMVFAELLTKYPDHELVARALYFAGWCYYSDYDFDNADLFFTRLSNEAKSEALKIKAFFFKAKSLFNLGKYEQAKDVFQLIYKKWPKASFADDAAYEYVNILSDQGKTMEAAESYAWIAKTYPKSPLIEDVLYRKGEVYYQGKLYDKAQNAFYEYRLKFPQGKLYDAALYWGGLSAFNLGEKYGAVLLWEKIIKDYPESPFRPNALKKTAEVYSTSSEYSKALSLYTEIISSYPLEASAVNADQKAEELRYRILGLDSREAELTVSIEKNRGVESKEGREALLSLAHIYIFEAAREKIDLAYNLLLKVSEKKEDADTSSRAQYLIGEYWYIKGDYIKAGNEFLKGALLGPSDKDLMAISIYKSAEMMKLAGKINEVKDLVKRLKKNFPSSQWAVEGERLLEGLQ